MSNLPRVERADDPRRCRGTTKVGQCWNIAVDGAEYCEACSGRDLVLANRRSYQLTNPKYHARFIELSEDEDIKSLREEMALIRVLIEERFNQIQDSNDVAQHSGAISSLVLTLERLRTRSHIIEQNLGQLLHKTTVAKLVREFIIIVNEEVRELPGGVEAIDRIMIRCKESAVNARNTEQARGLKLLEHD
jgi:hypothetical protein